MNLESIGIITFGQFEKIMLDKISEGINQEFQFPVRFREGHLDLSEYFEPTRGQYNGNKLLQVIDLNFSHDNFKTIGLFQVDLFIPILTYIFGQAFLNGRTGIASYYRLSNERYGMKTDEKVVIERFQKEVIHELGHTFGLVHCHTPDCVMRSSTYVEDIDQKSSSLCHQCKEGIADILEMFGLKIP